ncbi:hypothetical protein [Mycobacterium sp. JS623]|uniref:hypothetical protein n=1 Tax=Mycobacterium sp. JS623 TaxID=212767 RepID=UPI0002E41736|nr:hypothetical protein [Mycobacterium sp. JS623]
MRTTILAASGYEAIPARRRQWEENPDPDDPAVIVVARSTQEAIVVNLVELYALSDSANQG